LLLCLARSRFAVWVRAVIGPDTIQRVRQETDLVGLVRESMKLERAGRSFRGLCPFHQEKTPSFHVNPERAFYHCFGCGAHGDAISFVEQIEGMSFVDAVRRLAERLGIEILETLNEDGRRQQNEERRRQQALYDVGAAAAAYFEKMLREHPLKAAAEAELARRGLVPTSPTDRIADALQAFRIGYAPHGWDGLCQQLRTMGLSHTAAEEVGLLVPRRSGPGHYDRFRHRLMFAVLDLQGRVVAFSGRALAQPTGEEVEQAGLEPFGGSGSGEPPSKYVNSTESPIYKKREAVFGLYQARQALREKSEAVLVEGNFDVVSLYAHGIRHVVAPLGTSFTPEQARLIKRFAPTVTFLFDGDRAGRAAAIKARSVCQEAQLYARVASLPDGTDPDDFVRSRGADALGRVLTAARGMLEYLIDNALERVRAETDPKTRTLRITEVAELLAREDDPAVRAVARERADSIVKALGITDSTTFQALFESINRTVGQQATDKASKQSDRPATPWNARSADLSAEVPLRILGALLDFPELLDSEEVVSGLTALEGDPAAAIARVHEAWEDCRSQSAGVQGRQFREQVLARVPSSIHAFAAARLALPLYDSPEEAGRVLLENIGKLHRLQLKPQKPEVVAELRRVSALGDTAQEDALLLAHQNRLVSELQRVLCKREHHTPAKR
jgi:DNA primase